MFRKTACLTLVALFSSSTFAPVVAPAQNLAEQAEVTWDQVKPVFQKRCFACHRGEQARGGLDLSSVAAIKSGSTSGAIVVSGKPEESMIYTLPAHLENPRMPPNRAKIAQRELDLIYGWIQGELSERVTVTSASPSMSSRPLATRPRPIVNRAAKSTNAGSIKTTDASKLKSTQPTTALDVAAKIVPLQSYVVTALACSPTASLAAVSAPSRILIYRWTDQSQIASIPYPEGDVFSLRFSSDGSILIAGGGTGAQSGTVTGFDVLTGERLFQVGAESDVVLAADISPDGRLIALGGPSRTTRIFDSISGMQVAEMKKHTDWVLSASFSNDGLLLATGDRFGSLLVWEAATGKEFATLRGHTGAINALAWSADSNELISAGEDGTVRFWNMHDCVEVRNIAGETGGILAADFNAAGRMVIGGRDAKISVRASSDDATQIITMRDEVTELAMTHDGTHVIASDATGDVKLFSLDSGKPVAEFVVPVTGQANERDQTTDE